jgi:hypothetical protein
VETVSTHALQVTIMMMILDIVFKDLEISVELELIMILIGKDVGPI